MKLFQNLIDLSTTTNNLQDYIDNFLHEVYDFENSSYSTINESRDEIDEFILFKTRLVSELDFSKPQSRSFLILLYDLAQRLGLGATLLLENIINNNDLIVGNRIDAAKLYLTHITSNTDFLSRFDTICEKLQLSIDEDEEDIKKVIATFISYVSKLAIDTGLYFTNQLIEKVKGEIIVDRYRFLKSAFIKKAISVDFSNTEEAHGVLQDIIEQIFERDKVSFSKRTYAIGSIEIEDNTSYATAIKDVAASFMKIREVNVGRYLEVRNDLVYNSLNHGIAILQKEEQLLGYIYSYGKKHFSKMINAYQFLDNILFNSDIDIIDWGCGQGIATMIYLEELNKKRSEQEINSITLIEPSEIALKRAALHVFKFTRANNMIGINKDLDSLIIDDLKTEENKRVKLHLFSNILDIEDISLTKLLDLISNSYQGLNYFVCVSPYINDVRNGRLDAFVNFFRSKDSFLLLGSVDTPKSIDPISRVIRVFKVFIR